MPALPAIAPDYLAAARATAAGSRSFYFAGRFLPDEMARAAHAIYWFCRFTDDLVDEPDPPCTLDAWESGVRAALEHGCAAHPVLATFADTVRRYRIPHEYAYDLIRGMRMDLEHSGYETFAELRLFCYRAASVVGLMMCHAIGFRGNALAHAEDLGIAMQLTNILRDVGADLAMGRVYLPRAEMRRFGYGEAALRARVRNDAFRDLMRYQIARARYYYRAAEPGFALLAPRGRFAIRLAADLYSGILRRIEANDYEVFHTRAAVSPARKLWTVARHAMPEVVR